MATGRSSVTRRSCPVLVVVPLKFMYLPRESGEKTAIENTRERPSVKHALPRNVPLGRHSILTTLVVAAEVGVEFSPVKMSLWINIQQELHSLPTRVQGEISSITIRYVSSRKRTARDNGPRDALI